MDKYLIKKLRTQDSSTWWWLWPLDLSTKKKKKIRNTLEKIPGVATAHVAKTQGGGEMVVAKWRT